MIPLFINLSGQACLVVGGGRVAERKITWLLGGGAEVAVVARDATPQLQELAARGRLQWCEREYESAEAAGYFLIIAATNDPAVNEQVSRDARSAGRLINAVDAPDLSNIFTSAVVGRGELQIAISTSGACPALARRLREEMEERYPAAYDRLLRRLRRFRGELRDVTPDPRERKATLERIVRSDELARFLEGDEGPLEDLLKQCAS